MIRHIITGGLGTFGTVPNVVLYGFAPISPTDFVPGQLVRLTMPSRDAALVFDSRSAHLTYPSKETS